MKARVHGHGDRYSVIFDGNLLVERESSQLSSGETLVAIAEFWLDRLILAVPRTGD
jgi:hypothetical protein